MTNTSHLGDMHSFTDYLGSSHTHEYNSFRFCRWTLGREYSELLGKRSQNLPQTLGHSPHVSFRRGTLSQIHNEPPANPSLRYHDLSDSVAIAVLCYAMADLPREMQVQLAI